MDDFSRMRANEARLLARASNSLLGLCSGLLADTVLNEQEARFLNLWLLEHDDIAEVWPGSVLRDRATQILADGQVSEEELSDLKEALQSLLGGTWEQTGAVDGLATTLPVQHVIAIEIPDQTFCFTGRFAFGTRAACEREVVSRGGRVSANVTRNLNYLVIGTFVTPDWANTSFGRKIGKAVAYRDNGCPLTIIDERAWCAALESP